MSITTTIPTGHELVRVKVIISGNITNVQGVTGQYISRIQCMKAGIDMQLEEMYKSHPNKRVILIAFNGSVHIIGNRYHKFIILIYR
jgi:methanogenic corrinoid protein MtbC1